MRFLFIWLNQAQAVWYIPSAEPLLTKTQSQSFYGALPTIEKILLAILFLVLVKPLIWKTKENQRRHILLIVFLIALLELGLRSLYS